MASYVRTMTVGQLIAELAGTDLDAKVLLVNKNVPLELRKDQDIRDNETEYVEYVTNIDDGVVYLEFAGESFDEEAYLDTREEDNEEDD